MVPGTGDKGSGLIMGEEATRADMGTATMMLEAAIRSGRSALNEWEAKTLFAAYGIPVPSGALVTTAVEAGEVAERIGGRLAMKAIGADIHHKTEAGLVLLNVEGAEAAAESFHLLQQRAGSALEAVLVEQMIVSNREFMVGMKRDPVFGPVVVFGLGGVLTEALGDIAMAVAPLSDLDAAELPGLIKAKRLLEAFRGYPPVDQTALSTILQTVSRMAIEHPEISEIDMNPLLIDGDQPVAADALVILGPVQEPLSRPAFQPNLRAVLAPRSIAVIGASDDVGKWGGSALRNILDGHFRGPIYPVNPKGGVYFGLQVYPNIEALPEAPDLALLAVGARQIAPMIEACGRRGIPAAIAIAAGFSEIGEEGAKAERELARLATENNVTLIGPNCMGMLSNEQSLHAVGYIVLHPAKGKVSFMSQSGNLGTGIVDACERRGIGIDKFVSVGNEAQVGAIDLMECLRDDPNTRSIMLYLEGINDGQHFLKAARETTTVKPVVVLRGGLSDLGSQAAASHTGAMAGSGPVYHAAARQTGVVTCTSPDEAVDIATCLAYLPMPKGPRVGIVTNGGGAGVLMADEVARNGLTLPECPPDLLEGLDQILPPFWSRRNPIDTVASAVGDMGPRVLDLVARCDAFDAIVILSVLGAPTAADDGRPTCNDGVYQGLSPWEAAFMAQVNRLIELTEKPIISVPDTPIPHSLLDSGGRYAPIVLPSAAATGRALRRMVWYGSYLRSHGLRGERK
ncbi:MAG: acetate--CoA ligase family protein [Thermoleophilia bacterium]|jgi:acyl-CoA synthetase (NDP forming)